MEATSENYQRKMVEAGRLGDIELVNSFAASLDRLHTRNVRETLPEQIAHVLNTKVLTNDEKYTLAKASYILRRKHNENRLD